MNIKKKSHTTIIKDTEGNVKSFLENLTKDYADFKEQNLVLDISEDKSITLENVLSFLSLSNKHRKAKKSFVIVVKDFDFNEVPDEMNVVPTVQEAHDIIEMEEIERDLGF
jgi:hypothetical protein